MSKKILLVEDNDLERKTIKKAVEEKGYQVIEANNCTDGLKLLEDNKDIWLVLADRYIPPTPKRQDSLRIQVKERAAIFGTKSGPLGESIIKKALENNIPVVCISSFNTIKDQELQNLIKEKEQKDLYSYTGKNPESVIEKITELENFKKEGGGNGV